MASSWFRSSGATPHMMTMTNTPTTRLLPMSQVRSSKLVLGLVAETMSGMVEDWISQANTRQRKGRAGRVNPGFRFCLYTQHRYKNLMHPYQAKEPPQEEAIASALSILYEVESGFDPSRWSIAEFVLVKDATLVRWPVVGEVPCIFKNAYRVHGWCVELANEVGCTVATKAFFFRIIYTCDVRNVEYIYKTNFPNFPKGKHYNNALDMVAEGIFNGESEHWRAQRKLANLTFMSKEFRSLSAKVAQQLVQDSLFPLLDNAAHEEDHDGSILDFEDVFARFAFDSVSTVLFGRNPRSLSSSMTSHHPLAEALNKATKVIFYRHIMAGTWWKICRIFKFGIEKEMFKSLKVIDEHMTNYIATKREEILKGVVQKHDVLGLYMTSKELEENKLIPKGDQFLKDSAMSFLFTGKDSTTATLSWFFWLMIENPREEAKILEELKLLYNTKLIMMSNNNNKVIKKPSYYVFSYDTLKGLVYLHAPYGRGGVGEGLLGVQAERWIDGESGKLSAIRLSKLFAFNVGPRNCIGREMAFTR
ncbi:hypothetical protein Syun_013617 [Stephania yunnanensis]|uniref:Cytochrome P450 n=1 Tax=Stephania yunnanensis TaxID=152371 RepID=A0AAP0P7S6_9MAGN